MKQLCLLFLILIFGCKKSNSNFESDDEIATEEYGYADGTYCAEVDYYYSETGTRSTYTLEVEIEDNELTVIHWPNGGWLDSSHFLPPDISDGEASFTSDANVDYTVRIIGEEGDCVTDSYAKDEDDLRQEKEDQEEEEEDRIREENETREAEAREAEAQEAEDAAESGE
jgi:hypothetical protein